MKVLLLYIKLPNQGANYLKDSISQENGDYELKDHTFEVLLSSSGYENKVQTQRGMEEKILAVRSEYNWETSDFQPQ